MNGRICKVQVKYHYNLDEKLRKENSIYQPPAICPVLNTKGMRRSFREEVVFYSPFSLSSKEYSVYSMNNTT
jgi:hypothetical protein